MPTPIHALPSELLSEIFESLLLEQWRRRDLPRVMLVCRRWRATALETAALWAEIDIDSKQPIELFAERALGFPLTIYGEFEDEDNVQLERALLLLGPTYLPRIRDIYFTFGIEQDSDTAAPILDVLMAKNVHAPQLESIVMNCEWSDITPVNVAAFIAPQAPRLSSLVLEGFLFPWGLSLPSLRWLNHNLTNTPGVASLSYTLEDILHSLSSMPHLEELILYNALPEIFGSGLQVAQKHESLSMTNMRTLELGGSGEEALAFWMLLGHCPRSTHVSTTGGIPPSPALVTTALIRCIRHLSPHADARYSLKLWQAESGNSTPTIEATLLDLRDDSSFPYISLTNRIDLPDLLSLELLRVIKPFLKNIEKLELRGTAWIRTYAESAPLLALAQRLREITISGASPLKLFMLLLLATNPRGEKLPLQFPLLTTMRISHVNFMPTFTIVHDTSGSYGEHLSRILQTRANVGRRLELLCMHKSTVLESTVEAWKAAVKTFEWDGHLTYGLFDTADRDEDDGSHYAPFVMADNEN